MSLSANLPLSAAVQGANDIVQISNLNYYFGQGEQRTQVLFNNTLKVSAGEMVIMTGPSGSGKTTLLTLLGAIRGAQEGGLSVFGQALTGLTDNDLLQIRRKIGFIFQMHNLFDSLTAIENVKMATHFRDKPEEQAHEEAKTLLVRLGLGRRLNYKPGSLSGGQRQRVAVARALVNRPQLILADEPTAALDKDSSIEVVTLLREMAVENQSAIVMVTHDNRILGFADRMLHMVDGNIVSDVNVRETLFICDELRKIDMFSRMNAVELATIANRMTYRSFIPHEVLIREGDVGEEFFLVRTGLVNVIFADGTQANTDGPIKFFGEMALISGKRRNATVVAASNGALYVMNKADFELALASTQSFEQQLTNHLYRN